MADTFPLILSSSSEKRLTVVFPPRLVSTNTETVRTQLSAFWQTAEAKLNKWEHLELDLRSTEFVDSIGLNLIFDLVRLAEDKSSQISAYLGSRAVRLTFYTVRLDKRMAIHLMDTGGERL